MLFPTNSFRVSTAPCAGFTLVELAIVLTLIGLLVGGVMTGQSLMKAAALNGTVKQLTEVSQGMNTFRDKYFAIPGDMPNAASFWTGAVSGNGNGSIETASTGGCVSATLPINDPDCGAFNGERSQFFVHLGLAGLTTSYDGSTTLGKGYPAVKMYSGDGMVVTGPWTVSGGSNIANFSSYATDPMYLYLGVCNPSSFGVDSNFNDCAIFTADEASSIDTKLDDGLPLSGKVLGESYNTACLNTALTGYNIRLTSQSCNLLYSLR